MKNMIRPLAILTFLIGVSAGITVAQTLPPVEPLPPHTKGDYQIVTWRPGSWVDSTDISAFLLQWSRNSTFSPLLDAAKNIDLSDTVIIRVPEDAGGVLLPEDTIWYRVVAVKGINTRIYSAARYSVQDATPPLVGSFDLLSGTQPVGAITNQANLRAAFTLIEPAGLDTVGLYYRLGGEVTWNLLQTWPTPSGLDFEHDFTGTIASNGDNLYELAVGAIDLARPPGWPDSSGRGNILMPGAPDIVTGVDTHTPTGAIDTDRLDSLYAVDHVELNWTASDAVQAYTSGLDSVALLWTAYSAATGSVMQAGSTVLAHGAGAPTLDDSVPFTFDHDNAYYVFRLETSDLAGNVDTTEAYDSVRVHLNLAASLTLYDPLDADDTTYCSSPVVGVRTALSTASRADSLYLCASLDPADINSCGRYYDVGLPFLTTYTFRADSTQQLYLKAWAGDTLVTDDAEIIIDTIPPADVEMVLLSTSGSASTIQMRFEGTERPLGDLQAAVVWEEGDQSNPQILPLSSFGETVVFHLSEDFDEKTIYARVEDRAENRSNLTEATFLRIEAPHSYPNPFNPDEGQTAHIMCVASENTTIDIYIYDLLGNLVLRTSALPPAPGAGPEAIFEWDGHNGRGEPVASGGYICVLEQNGSEIGKIKIAVVR